MPSVHSPGAKRASVRGVPWSFRLRFAQNFPEKAFFRECSSDQPHQMKGFTSLILGSQAPFSGKSGKVRAKWHLVTASLVLGQIAQSTSESRNVPFPLSLSGGNAPDFTGGSGGFPS